LGWAPFAWRRTKPILQGARRDVAGTRARIERYRVTAAHAKSTKQSHLAGATLPLGAKLLSCGSVSRRERSGIGRRLRILQLERWPLRVASCGRVLHRLLGKRQINEEKARFRSERRHSMRRVAGLLLVLTLSALPLLSIRAAGTEQDKP